MRIIEEDFDSIVQRFGASRRFVTRVGALARKGLLLSESLVEFSCDEDGKPLEDLLLAKALLDGADALDAKALKALATKQDKDFFAENPLALHKHGDKRVLCLAEESDENAPPPEPANALIATAQGGIAALIGAPEAAKLLGADEVARLKLDLLTSADQGKRLEAVRKLWLAKLTPAEKLQLFLAALRDKDSEVRAEAARALGALGLDAALTDNVAKASAGNLAERVVAISNMGQIFGRLDGAQQKLALSVAAGFLRSSEPRELVLACLGLLSVKLGETAELGDFGLTLHKQLFEMAQVQLAVYEDAMRGVYEALYKLDRKLATKLLITAVEESSQSALQFFALGLICRFDLEGAAEPRVMARLVVGVQTGSDLDRNYQTCVGALNALKERAVPTIVAALPKADDLGQARIIGLLGHMMRSGELPREAGKQAAQACLEAYPAASVSVRVVLLESGFFEHDYLGEDEKRVAAENFMADLHTFRFERQIELLQNALRRCGRAAIAPLTRGIMESSYDITRLTAAALLPDVVEHDKKIARKELQKLIDQLRKLIEVEENTFPNRGPLYIALARIASHKQVPSDEAGEIGKLLRAHVGKTSAVYDVIDAMGYLAAGESLDGRERIEIGHLLLSFLKRALPTVGGSMKKNAQGEDVLEFGRETTAYTDMVPRVLDGLGRLLQAAATPKALYSKVLADLTQLWRAVTDYKMIWAPASVITLGRLLGEVALSGREKEAVVDDIAELLARRVHLLPIMQVLGRLASINEGSERLDRILQNVMTELLRRLSAEQEPEIVERRQILETMFQIAGRKRIGEKPIDAEAARRNVVEALFDAMKERTLSHLARGWLEQLASAKHLSENQRADIKRRMKPLGTGR
jgi:hypothetical protein